MRRPYRPFPRGGNALEKLDWAMGGFVWALTWESERYPHLAAVGSGVALALAASALLGAGLALVCLLTGWRPLS